MNPRIGKIIWLFLLFVVACGCKKDTHDDPYYINYKEGQEYEQIFYVLSIDSQHKTLTLLSIDHRLGIAGISSDSPLAPQILTKPNLEETDDLKLYQVADFRFVYKGKGSMEEIYTKTKDWRWVYGCIKDYSFPDGSIHQRIEIVSEIE